MTKLGRESLASQLLLLHNNDKKVRPEGTMFIQYMLQKANMAETWAFCFFIETRCHFGKLKKKKSYMTYF